MWPHSRDEQVRPMPARDGAADSPQESLPTFTDSVRGDSSADNGPFDPQIFICK